MSIMRVTAETAINDGDWVCGGDEVLTGPRCITKIAGLRYYYTDASGKASHMNRSGISFIGSKEALTKAHEISAANALAEEVAHEEVRARFAKKFEADMQSLISANLKAA